MLKVIDHQGKGYMLKSDKREYIVISDIDFQKNYEYREENFKFIIKAMKIMSHNYYRTTFPNWNHIKYAK